IRMNAQGLGDAGAKAVSLDEGADERANVIDAGAIDQVAQSFGAGLAGAHQRLVEGKAGFDANDGEIESVGKRDADAPLTVPDHALEKEARNKETEGGNADQEWNAIDAGENDDAGKTENRQHNTGAEIVADMAGLAESSLDEPGARAGDIGGGKRDGLADGIERLLDALADLHRWFFLGQRGLATEGAQAGSQHGTGRDSGCAKGENHQHDGDKDDDGQNQRHSST